MKREFTDEYEVTFFETDTKNRLSPGYMLALFQDTAVNQFEDSPYTIEYLLENKRGWMILNWHIVIERMPVLEEKIRITTWCGKCGRMQAARSFTAEDEKGERIAYAITNWAFVDLEKRKPANIMPEMVDDFLSEKQNVIENEKYRIRKPSEEEFVFGNSFTVMRSDLDTNGHMNNTRYLVWAVDSVDDDIYDNYELFDIKVTYRKECTKGDELLAKKAVWYDGDIAETVIYFVDKNDHETIFVQIGLEWRKK